MQPKIGYRTNIDLGRWFVAPEEFPAQDQVPRQPAGLGHIDEAGNVVIRERGGDVSFLQAPEAGDGVGLGLEPVPGRIEEDTIFFVQVAEPIERGRISSSLRR